MDNFLGNHMIFRRNVGDQSLQQSIKEGEQKKSTANDNILEPWGGGGGFDVNLIS